MRSIREILEELQNGTMDIETAMREIELTRVAEIDGLAIIDVNRERRTGVPEVIFAESKQPDALARIATEMLKRKGYALMTRMNEKKLAQIADRLGNAILETTGDEGHLTVLAHTPEWTPPKASGRVAIITAGTSDIVYAREAEAICKVMGVETMSFYDVGIAGIHRLVQPMQAINESSVNVVIVFAGMEGALPTVVASLVDIPVIGVPVPTGYGHGGHGETALMSMLQSCAPGLAVVNIGNGLGAGAFAALIAKQCKN